MPNVLSVSLNKKIPAFYDSGFYNDTYGGGGWGGGVTMNKPISTEGSGMPTMGPKTGLHSHTFIFRASFNMYIQSKLL